MLKSWRCHQQYQEFVKNKVAQLRNDHANSLRYYDHLFSKLWFLNLDPVMRCIAKYYPDQGRPAVNQPELLRALIAMNHIKCDAITRLVDKLRSEPVLAIACGFDIDTVPGVGTFYDFINRLWLEESKKYVCKKQPKPKKPKKKDQKVKPKHPGIVQKLVEKALQGRTVQHSPQHPLQELFAEAAVTPSAKMGLLGDTNNLTISGDGTCIESGSNPRGKPTCKCRENGIYKCNCKRRYSDPQATWGWDSYNERYFWGYSLYVFGTCDGGYDLPIYLHLAQAKRHDSCVSIFALSRFRSLHPRFSISKALYDSAHDAYAIYRLHYAWNIEPFIDLNSKQEGNRKYSDTISISEDGIPICPANLPMVNWGYNPNDRNRIKWRCPKVCRKDCNCDKNCSDSPYGRTFYTKPEDDYRLFTPTPRKSKQWKKIFNKRSSVERCNKRLTVDYATAKTRCRSKKGVFLRQVMAGINVHLDAQIKHRNFSFLSHVIGALDKAS